MTAPDLPLPTFVKIGKKLIELNKLDFYKETNRYGIRS